MHRRIILYIRWIFHWQPYFVHFVQTKVKFAQSCVYCVLSCLICFQKPDNSLLSRSFQHYPLYRVSDAGCTGQDAAPPEERHLLFREKYDVLSKEASHRVSSVQSPQHTAAPFPFSSSSPPPPPLRAHISSEASNYISHCQNDDEDGDDDDDDVREQQPAFWDLCVCVFLSSAAAVV